jgi:hypothetical protein
LACLGDAGVAFESEFFRLTADRNESGGFGEEGSNTDGPAAQFGAILLLDGREERVEVDGEVAEHGATIERVRGASINRTQQ